MPLAQLENFSPNIQIIHQALELFAPIARASRAVQPNWLHIALDIHPYGLSSGKYLQGSELQFNFEEGIIYYHRPDGNKVSFSLKSHSQKSLLEAILAAMQTDELAEFFANTSGDSLTERLINKILAHKSEAIPQALATVSHEDKLSYNLQLGKDYADALYTVFTGVARFRARLNGHLTPIVVWPEHFDLSTLWFKDADMDDYKAHINIGFAPYTPNQFERPYLYAYAYPYPENFEPAEAPSPAFWHHEGWRGLVVHYDDIAQADDSAAFVETMCHKIFAVLRGVLA